MAEMNPASALSLGGYSISESIGSLRSSFGSMTYTKNLTGIDLCAGAGGLTLGFQQAGIDVVGAVEVDRRAAAIHEANFPECPVVRDSIVDLTGRALRKKLRLGNRKIDIVFGGPPCQGFSQIGKRDRLDERNDVLISFARLATELRPRIIVAENVRGLLMGWAKEKRTQFETLLRQAGYDLQEPWVLDASEYGVPQRRSRVFLVAVASGTPYPSPPKPSSKKPPTTWDAIRDLAVVFESPNLLEGHIFKGRLGKPTAYSEPLQMEAKDGISATCMKMPAHGPSIVKRFSELPEGKTDPISRFQKLAKSGRSCTLRAGTGPDRGSFMACRPIHPTQPRCITVREAARLHGFPDWFEFDPEHWHGFRQIGNSVPPPLAKAVAGALILSRT